MGVIKKEGLKQSFVTYIGVLIGTVNTMYFYPKFLNPDELGLFRFLIETSSMLFPFISLGVHNLSVRMFPTFRNEKNGHNGLLFFLVLGVIVGYLFFLVAYLLLEPHIIVWIQEKSELIQSHWKFIVPLAGLTILSAIGNQYVLNFKKVMLPAIFEDLYLKFGLPLIAVCYFWGYISIVQGVYILVGIYILKSISIYIYILSIGEWHWKPNWSFLKKPLFKEMRIYAFYGILGSIGTILATRIDVFMLAILALNDLNDVGIYSIAMFIANVITVPSKAITNIASPIIADSWKNNDLENIKSIYSKSSIVLLTIGSFFLIGVWCSIDDLFRLMPKGDLFASGKYVILFLGIGKLFDLATGANDQIILYSKYFRFNFYAILVLALLNVVSNYVLIPIYQINGAALATMGSIIIYNLSKYLFIYFKLKIQPFSINTLKILVISSAVFLVGSNVPSLNIPFVDIIIRSGVISILFIYATIYFKVSQDINDLFWQILSKLKLK